MNLLNSVLDVIRQQGSLAGPILDTLVRRGDRASSIAELARAVNGTPSSTMREVNRLVDLDLVTSEDVGRSRQLRFNRENPFAPALLDLLFIAYGASLPPKYRRIVHFGTDDGYAMAAVSDFVPPELKTGMARYPNTGQDLSKEPAVYDGPSPEECRALVLELGRIKAEAVKLENALQVSYSRWKTDRDRDLIHVVLHAGEGSAYAAGRLLKASLGQAANETAAISQIEWARAVYGTWAEALTCRKILNYLENELDTRAKWESAQHTVKAAAEWAELGQSSPEWQQRSEAAVVEINKIKKRFSDIEVVGLAGERLLAVAAQEVYEQAHKTAVRMASHPSFLDWKAAHPDIVQRHPGPPDQVPEGDPDEEEAAD